MDFFDVIERRYTHKETFLNEPVPRAHLEAIARAGLSAPNAANAQAVSLIIVDDAATLKRLCGIASSGGLRSAPAAIAVMVDPAAYPEGVYFGKEDYSAAAENMLLAATALGYASVWLDSILTDREKQRDYLRALGAPESFILPVILPIGKPDGEGSHRAKKPYSERLSYNTYGKQG